MKKLWALTSMAGWGSLSGCALGFLGGFPFYFLVAQPLAAKMQPWEAASYLCSAGKAPIAFALLGIFLGFFFGLVLGVLGELRLKEAKQNCLSANVTQA